MGRSTSGFGVRDKFQFTASGSETSISGSDDNGRTLKFSDGKYVDVYLNGVYLDSANDYNTSTTNIVEFETSINNVLNKATEQSGKIGRKSLSKNNRFLMIVNSGSKGSLINFLTFF